MPLPERTKTITLEAAGAPEFSVTFIRMQGMPYAEMLKVYAKPPEGMTDLDHIKQKFAALIESWTVEDYDGNIYPLPKNDDTVIDRFPTVFIERISEEMLLDAGTGLDLVNGNKTSSQQDL